MKTIRLWIALVSAFAIGGVQAAAVSQLLDRPVQTEGGTQAGLLRDLIVDVDAGRVLYVVLEARGKFHTLPVRALGKDLRLDMEHAGEPVRRYGEDSPRFRRASELLGDEVTHAHPGGPTEVGTLRDIEFDPVSGRVETVVVATPQGEAGFGASVLAQRRFPPLDRPEGSYADKEELGERGWIRGQPSDQRRRLHDPEWGR